MLNPGTEPAEGEVLLGKYRLDRLIGKGGMGKVFRAEDLQNGSVVAVKVLSSASHDEESRRRFAREAKIMGGLDHPNLIRLFGHGEERGFPFLVMRFLEGKNLLDTLDTTSGRMGVTETLDVIGQLAGALDHLHTQGIIHRDLKLSNIFQGPDGKVTLLDMGLARAIPSTTQLTRIGVIWGTPEFMAPEQILGEQKLDGRADVYALAGIFFRIISGRLAFAAGDEQKLLESHVKAPRPDLRTAVPSVPAAVAEVVKTAMSVRRDERYPTAGKFHQALKAAFAGLPAPQPGESTVVARTPTREPTPLPSTLKAPPMLPKPPPPVLVPARPPPPIPMGSKAGVAGPRPTEFDEPMTMPAIDVAFAQKKSSPPVEPPSAPSGPPTNPPMERTVVTDIGVPSTSLVGDESTAVTSYPDEPVVRSTRAAPPSTATHLATSAGTDPGTGGDLTVAGDVSNSSKTPGAVTAPGRPSAKERDMIKSARNTMVDEDSPFLPDLPGWATPWVLAGVGAGLVLLGFLLGLLMR